MVVGRSTYGIFVEGSTLLLFEGSVSTTDSVGFNKYTGIHHTHHSERPLHTASLISPIVDHSWEKEAFSRLQKNISMQLSLAFGCPKVAIGNLEATIRFGTVYMINLSNDVGGIFIEDLEKYILKGRILKKPWLWEEQPELKMPDFGEEKLKRAPKSNIDDESMAFKKKDRKLLKGCSKSLFTHIIISFEQAIDYAQKSGFVLSEKSEDYALTMKVNKSKEVRIILNEALKIKAITHRPLRWVAASLISSDSHDSHCCVYYINSLLDVSRENQEAFMADNGKIVFKEGDNIRIAEKYRDRVPVVRHKKYQTYKKGNVTVWIGKVNTYSELNSSNGCGPSSSHVEFEYNFGELGTRHVHNYAFMESFWKAGLDFLTFLKLHSN